ncbi:MAG TPA: hypothetical protein VHF91_07205, partial [Acidimicrobiales bacterium]|nr:hypothetical protein [Acidimicrobiales bacterium]
MARGARRWSALLVLALLASVPIPPGARAAQTTTGGLDPSFGREGVYRLDMTQPSLDVAHDSVMGRAGLIAAGSAGDRFALAAFNSDPYRFANGHQQRIVDFGRPSAAHAVAEQNSRLVAAGRAGDDFALVHLQPNGDPAAGFPDEGRVRTSFGAPAVAYGLAPMAELAHLAVGTVQSGTGSSVAMARYDRAGRLDPSFGSGGRVVLDVTAGLDSANAVYVLPWGGGSEPILVAGQAGAGALVARLRGDGTPDPAFGAGGHVVLDLSPGDDVARSVVPFGSGILVAGSAGSQAFLAALGPTGALDPAFGVGGV